ncbi:MAG: pentapeptide repeat-containing protein [Bacteroidetes bacterium]|nr:pentapeptide repeat-containing protein [Bacteroidota bacterium]
MKKSKKNLKSIEAFFLFLVTVSFTVLSGCSDTLTNSTGTVTENQTKVEREFSLSSVLKASPDELIVVDLEDLNSPSVSGDTGPVGEDVIPYTYTKDINQEFRVAPFSTFKIKFVSDATGDTLAQVFPGGFAQLSVPAGNYKLHLISFDSYSSSDLSSNIIFIKPSVSGSNIVTHLKAKECIECNFKNTDLSGMNFTDVTLSRSSFTGVNLRNANLRNAYVDSCRMENTNLDSANLINSWLPGTKWGEGSSLQYAVFDSAYMVGCEFSKVQMKGVSINRVHFARTNILYSNMLNATVINSDFDEVKIYGSGFSYTNFTKTAFINAQIQSSNFDRCNLTDTDFGRSALTQVNMAYANIIGAYFCESQKTGITTVGIIYNSTTQCWP